MELTPFQKEIIDRGYTVHPADLYNPWRICKSVYHDNGVKYKLTIHSNTKKHETYGDKVTSYCWMLTGSRVKIEFNLEGFDINSIAEFEKLAKDLYNTGLFNPLYINTFKIQL